MLPFGEGQWHTWQNECCDKRTVKFAGRWLHMGMDGTSISNLKKSVYILKYNLWYYIYRIYF